MYRIYRSELMYSKYFAVSNHPSVSNFYCFPHGSHFLSWSNRSYRSETGQSVRKFREVHKILLANNYNVLMVDVRSGENFGKLTTRYLNRVYEESGTLLAVCTPNYGEKTASAHSSHEELIFALDNKDRVQILPLRVVDTYPPQPPFGPDHPFDKEGDARGLVRRLFPPSTVFQDCRKKSEIQIAAEIAERLRAHRFSA